MHVTHSRLPRTLLVCLATGSLAIALAHRTFHVSSTVRPVVQSEAQNVKNQYLSNNPYQWTIPERSFVLLAALPVNRDPVKKQSQTLSADRNYCIYCRPPPAG